MLLYWWEYRSLLVSLILRMDSMSRVNVAVFVGVKVAVKVAVLVGV